MNATEQLDQLLQSDVDDILHVANGYDTESRLELLRTVVERFEAFRQPIERVKGVWLVQSVLASLEDRQLPLTISTDVATRLASIVESNGAERDARRGALDSLALLFLKAQEVTEPLTATIRGAFSLATESDDRALSEFAREAMSSHGVLSRRKGVVVESVESTDSAASRIARGA